MGNIDLEGAKALIMKLHAEGLKNAEIAKRLKERGYKSERTGAPIDQFGVGYHIRTLKNSPVDVKLAPASNGHAKQAAPAQKSKVRLALDILTSDLDETTKQEIAARILNS